jgi:hypothetical protein
MARKITEAQRRARRKYNATEKAKKQRARNNKARRKAQREGWDKPGDGKDVAHKDNNTHNNSRSNLTHQSPSKNRTFDRTANGHRAKKRKKRR